MSVDPSENTSRPWEGSPSRGVNLACWSGIAALIGMTGLLVSPPAQSAPLRALETATPAIVQPVAEQRRILKVGPTRALKTPSDAAREVQDFDIVEIDAGRYTGDVATWRADGLTLRGAGGLAVLDAAGRSAEDKAIWVINGDDTLVDGIEFRNARVPDRNGAGIRAQGRNLTVKNSVFSNNENGILTINDPDSNVTIQHSRFIGNGHGDGYSHGIYIGQINKLVFDGNYVHGTLVGHHVKTRARQNEITYNFLIDGKSGSASYAVDMPNAETGILIGNIIHQGTQTQNYHLVNFQTERGALYLVNNTLINDYGSGQIARTTGEVSGHAVNNVIAGALEMPAGFTSLAGNVTVDKSAFVSADAYDFRLRAEAPAIDQGADPPAFEGQTLLPRREYRHPARAVGRTTERALDSGAFEFHAE